MTTTLQENQWRVFINGSLLNSMAVLNVSRVTGGKAVPTATFVEEIEAIDIVGGNQKRRASIHQDTDCRNDFDDDTLDPKLIEISRQRADGFYETVHVGRLVAKRLQLDPSSGEQTIYTSRFDHYLSGDSAAPIRNTYFANYKIADYLGGDTGFKYPIDIGFPDIFQSVNFDVVFNPVIDGRPRKNRCLETYTEGGDPTELKRPWPFDIDGVPTAWIDDAALPPADEIDWWSLADIVQYILFCYNNLQSYVSNPSRDELIAQLGEDRALVRNFKLKRGKYVAQVLDELLIPLGYNWVYVYGNIGETPKYYFWKRNLPASTRAIPLQRFDQIANVNYQSGNRTEVEAYSINYDAYSRSGADVFVDGGFYEYEATFELVPAWNPAHDSVPVNQLVESENNTAVQNDPTLLRTHRDWVLNEGGDYGGYAGATTRQPGTVYFDGLDQPYDLTSISSAFVLWTRRKFNKLLSVPKNDVKTGTWGMKQGITVRLWHPTKKEWVSLDELGGLSVQTLKDECGIRIGSTTEPPSQLAALFKPAETDPDESLRVQVVATVQSDARAVGFTTTGKTLCRLKDLYVDAGSRYKQAEIDATSLYDGDPEFTSRAYDSVPDLQNLAEHLQRQWNASTVSGSVTLIGTQIVGEYLGYEISSFRYRDIVVTATHRDLEYDGEPFEINPTVVSVNYDVIGNRTTLSLELLRFDRRRI